MIQYLAKTKKTNERNKGHNIWRATLVAVGSAMAYCKVNVELVCSGMPTAQSYPGCPTNTH